MTGIELILLGGGLAGGLLTIGKLVSSVWKFTTNLVHKVDKVEALLSYEFTPNGGKSTKDQLNHIEEWIMAHMEAHKVLHPEGPHVLPPSD